jgi:hypothetical protein
MKFILVAIASELVFKTESGDGVVLNLPDDSVIPSQQSHCP